MSSMGSENQRKRSQMEKEQRETQEEQGEEKSLPLFSDEGVDLTLIRMMREKSPSERLRWLNDAANGILRLRRARRTCSTDSESLSTM